MKLRILLEDLKRSRFGKSRFFALLGAAVLGGVGLSLCKPIQQPFYSIFIALLTAATFELVVLLLDFVPMFKRRRMFRQMFFGRFAPGKVRLIFPEFVPVPTIPTSQMPSPGRTPVPLHQTGLFQLSIHNCLPFFRSQKVRERPNSALKNVSFDHTETAALQDLKALGYVAALIGEMSQETPEILTDTDLIEMKGRDSNLIMFGLFSNYFTDSSLRRGAEEFFEKEYDAPVGGHLTLKNPDWDCPKYKPVNELREYKDDTINDYGIILKFHPTGSDIHEKTWVIIAGVGADGTEGAGKYLAECWEELYNIKDKDGRPVGDREFAAIVRVPKNPDDPRVIDRCIVKPLENAQTVAERSGAIEKPHAASPV